MGGVRARPLVKAWPRKTDINTREQTSELNEAARISSKVAAHGSHNYHPNFT
jgi:hypothetical protein